MPEQFYSSQARTRVWLSTYGSTTAQVLPSPPGLTAYPPVQIPAFLWPCPSSVLGTPSDGQSLFCPLVPKSLNAKSTQGHKIFPSSVFPFLAFETHLLMACACPGLTVCSLTPSHHVSTNSNPSFFQPLPAASSLGVTKPARSGTLYFSKVTWSWVLICGCLCFCCC